MSVINLTTENFEEEVLNAKEPVLVDFWATWCGPCQTMGPVVDELAQELTDVKVGKVNVDEQMVLAREYKVMSIPTFLVFKDGKVAERTLGVQEKSELKQLFK
ncbi:thioredoxin [Coprococcus comes]|uniref:Thioredoxin n=1 Tax=Coprococcus comes TaxID=410072 RepID=A0A3E4GL78_9FIRM|nr:thioredoxin [Coprococcus comes]RGJ20286.1 thioredoxin [Coprococcus comes]